MSQSISTQTLKDFLFILLYMKESMVKNQMQARFDLQQPFLSIQDWFLPERIELSSILLRVFSSPFGFSLKGRIDSFVVFLFLIPLLLFTKELFDPNLGERSQASRRIEFFREEKGEVGEFVSVKDAMVRGVDSSVQIGLILIIYSSHFQKITKKNINKITING